MLISLFREGKIMSEKIDIFDANLKHIGVMERTQAHMEGHWHRTFHCWIVSPKENGSLLFQQRSMKMKNYPGLLDVSAAGHLEAGEPISAGIREVREELGIEIDESRLKALGERVEVADQANGQKNREYQSVFMYETDQPVTSFKPDPTEVAALFWLPIPEGMRLFESRTREVTVSGCSFEAGTNDTWKPLTKRVRIEDFLPRIQQYYLISLIMADRLIKRSGPLAIS